MLPGRAPAPDSMFAAGKTDGSQKQETVTPKRGSHQRRKKEFAAPGVFYVVVRMKIKSESAGFPDALALYPRFSGAGHTSRV